MAQMAQRQISSGGDRGMSPFIVVFDDWRGRDGVARHEQIQSQISLAEEHRERLQSFIADEGLSGDVYSVAPATSLGMIGIVATIEAAKRLATMNGVVRVIPSR